ncbi:Piwi, PAZ and DUF1785 domain protein [Purpureocillium lavendulum]|uniref:Piwi, PAZ and DUF1785 domain protein n=1 Tax=Purpureocillium lavendulum TaxID=1247861 RepID=A0AB34FJ93_9HYPO|nr:Piwi, PAZ and DUF1785 domain protein [Purpureocillium lavendulum]
MGLPATTSYFAQAIFLWNGYYRHGWDLATLMSQRKVWSEVLAIQAQLLDAAELLVGEGKTEAIVAAAVVLLPLVSISETDYIMGFHTELQALGTTLLAAISHLQDLSPLQRIGYVHLFLSFTGYSKIVELKTLALHHPERCVLFYGNSNTHDRNMTAIWKPDEAMDAWTSVLDVLGDTLDSRPVAPFAVVAKLCEEALATFMRTGTCQKEIEALQQAWDKACLDIRAVGWEGHMEEANSGREVQKLAETKNPRATTMRLANTLRVGDVNYAVGKMLGQGKFGVVYECEPIPDGEVVAIKFEWGSGVPLREEYRAYKSLAGCWATPNVHGYQREVFLHSVLVLDCQGPSLLVLFEKCGRVFSRRTLTVLFIHLLHLIEHLHNHGNIHRDLKPENILSNGRNNAVVSRFYLIDLASATPYEDPKTGSHIPHTTGHGIVGTPRYMSIDAHRGDAQSRRSDMQSLLYVFVYLAKGGLPWQGTKGSERKQMIRDAKEQVQGQELVRGIDEQLAEALLFFLQHVSTLRFEERPDYVGLRQRFRGALKMMTEKDEQCLWLDGLLSPNARR